MRACERTLSAAPGAIAKHSRVVGNRRNRHLQLVGRRAASGSCQLRRSCSRDASPPLPSMTWQSRRDQHSQFVGPRGGQAGRASRRPALPATAPSPLRPDEDRSRPAGRFRPLARNSRSRAAGRRRRRGPCRRRRRGVRFPAHRSARGTAAAKRCFTQASGHFPMRKPPSTVVRNSEGSHATRTTPDAESLHQFRHDRRTAGIISTY